MVYLKIGIYMGLQDILMEEFLLFWCCVDEVGFYWILVWDYFYVNFLQLRNDLCFEGVVLMVIFVVVIE